MQAEVSISTPDWTLRSISGVLIDKDGTLVDSHMYWGEIISQRSVALCDAFGLDAIQVERLESVMGFSRKEKRLSSSGPVGLVSRDEVISIVVEYLTTQNAKTTNEEVAKVFDYVHGKMEKVDFHLALISGALSFLNSLKDSGGKLALVTTDSLRATRLTLEKLRIASFFEVVIGRESCLEPKSSGVPATIALRELGVPGKVSICVGDAPMDVHMARRSGCKAAVGVATGQVSAANLLSETPFVVNNLRELSILQEPKSRPD